MNREKISPDILGLALMEYLNGNHREQIIIHSPDFEDDYIDVSWYFRDYAHMPGIEKKALQLVRGKVLDAGAGAGSHSLYMQRRGFNITAMDTSRGACQVMRERGIRKVIRDNILEWREDKFDTILMLMNGIGLVNTLEKLHEFIRNLPVILKPGGQLIIDSSNLIYLFEDEDGVCKIPLDENYYGEIQFQLEYRSLLSEPFKWLFIDFDNLRMICEKSGYHAEMIMEGENLQYLGKVTL